MKREALRHPKMLDLSARLGIDRARAIGIVTLLLDFTSDMATQGDVGKWPDGAIARACEWGTSDGDASIPAPQFIRALVDAKWLDEHPEARLLVHDWPVHCERYVKSKLRTLGIWFHPAYRTPIPDDTSPDTADDITGDPPRDQTKPNQTKPTPPQPKAGGGGIFARWTKDDKATVIAELNRLGLGRAIAVANEAETLGLSPDDVRGVCKEFLANRGKFSSVGAISERIRNGSWPANGVVTATEVEARAAKKAAKEAASVHEAVLGKIVRDGRKAKIPDEEIKAKVRAAVPLAICEREGW